MAKSIATFEAVFDGFLDVNTSFFSDQKKTITYSIESGGTVDPVTGAPSGATTTFYAAEGFRSGVQEKEFNDVKAGDLKFTCKQTDLNYTPQINDKPSVDGVVYTVIEVKDLGQVSWAVQLRG